jgi:hypothetical protein
MVIMMRTRSVRVLRSLGTALLAAAPLALAAGAASVATTRSASASVMIAVSFEALVSRSHAASVVTPVEQRSLWEDGRICTYTRVHIDRAVAGDLQAGTDTWVRSLGGVIGDVGQIVEGEPVLTVGRPSLLFLHQNASGADEVTARAQGQFPVVLDENKVPRVMKHANLGVVLPPKSVEQGPTPSLSPLAGNKAALAADVLHGRVIDDVARDIVQAWPRLHAQ